MKLYEINYEIEKILDAIDEELSEELYQELTDLNIKREEKIENTILYIKSLKAEAEMIENERKRLGQKEKSAYKKIQSVQDYLEAMLNGEKYKSPLNSVYYGSTSSVNVLNPALLPKEYIVEQEPSIDRRGLSRALKRGEKIDGAELEERTYMVIR